MKLNKAIKTLAIYNKWRRGADIKQPEPKLIGEAIDRVIEPDSVIVTLIWVMLSFSLGLLIGINSYAYLFLTK